MSHTGNPRHPNNPSDGPRESTGAIAQDSLAADSIRSGGDFNQNQDTGISPVPGSKSTLATTDTSAATVLQPASDGTSRDKQDALGLGSDEKGVSGVKYPDGAGGQGDFSGTHNSDGYVGGPSGGDGGSSRTTQEGYNPGADDTTGAFSGTATGSSGGPDENIKSGQSAADVASSGNTGVTGTQTKTFTGNVGGQYDPGRVAEQDLAKNTADTHGVLGDREGDTDNPYDALKIERA